MKVRKFTAALFALLLAFACLLAVGCADENGNEDENKPGGGDEVHYTITLSEAEHTITEDLTFTLTATVSPMGTVHWATDNNAVASVINGKVQAKTAGTANITATCGDASATCKVTVTPASGEVTVLQSDVSEYALEAGGAAVPLQFAVYNIAADGTSTRIEDAVIEYSVTDGEDNRFVTLEAGALLPKNRHGETQVRAQYGDIAAYADVAVYDAFISTPAEWCEMLESRSLGEMFLLTEDIDFAGQSYTGMNTSAPADGSSGAFRATVNGGGHTVKNITLSGSGYLSLFGRAYNAKIRNIAFENVTVAATAARAYGLVVSAGGNALVMENISLDLRFAGVPTEGAVLMHTFYGGQLSGIVATVITPNGNTEGDKVKLVRGGTPSASAVYVLGEGALASAGEARAYVHAIAMAWDVNGEKLLDQAYWQYGTATELPELLNR